MQELYHDQGSSGREYKAVILYKCLDCGQLSESVEVHEEWHSKQRCPVCKAEPGEPCVYTRGYSIHRDRVTGAYVPNQVGKPMLRNHYERSR